METQSKVSIVLKLENIAIRVLAHVLSTQYSDHSFRDALANDGNVREMLALRIFGSYEEFLAFDAQYGEGKVDRIAKNILVAKLYKQSAESYAKVHAIPHDVAVEIFEKFDREFPSIEAFVTETHRQLEEEGAVRSGFGDRVQKYPKYAEHQRKAQEGDRESRHMAAFIRRSAINSVFSDGANEIRNRVAQQLNRIENPTGWSGISLDPARNISHPWNDFIRIHLTRPTPTTLDFQLINIALMLAGDDDLLKTFTVPLVYEYEIEMISIRSTTPQEFAEENRYLPDMMESSDTDVLGLLSVLTNVRKTGMFLAGTETELHAALSAVGAELKRRGVEIPSDSARVLKLVEDDLSEYDDDTLVTNLMGRHHALTGGEKPPAMAGEHRLRIKQITDELNRRGVEIPQGIVH